MQWCCWAAKCVCRFGTGSPLSPLLFNIYTRDVHNIPKLNVKMVQYADDFVIYARGPNIPDLIREINVFMEELSTRFFSLNLCLSHIKSKAMVFSPRKSYNFPIYNITYEGKVISWANECKYVGVIFTENLNWSKQIDQMCVKAKNGINVMKAISRVWWGADPATMLVIYKGLVWSHLDYGSVLLNPTSKKNQYKLDNVQFEALRLVTGCMRSTPTNLLLSECAEMALEYRRLLSQKKNLC